MKDEEKKISVGSLVTAKRDLGLQNSDGVGLMDSRAGEAGVCFAVEGTERPEYGFIFQRGGCGGFSSGEVTTFLELSGSVSKEVADYQFKNVERLGMDYNAGRFDKAFEEQNIETAHERSAMPHPRDVLRREQDAIAKKPRNVALEKHGGSIEAQIERDLRDREPDLDMG
jgi:hypothetical protein